MRVFKVPEVVTALIITRSPASPSKVQVSMKEGGPMVLERVSPLLIDPGPPPGPTRHNRKSNTPKADKIPAVPFMPSFL